MLTSILKKKKTKAEAKSADQLGGVSSLFDQKEVVIQMPEIIEEEQQPTKSAAKNVMLSPQLPHRPKRTRSHMPLHTVLGSEHPLNACARIATCCRSLTVLYPVVNPQFSRSPFY